MPIASSPILVALRPDLLVALDGTIIRKTTPSGTIVEADPDLSIGDAPVLAPIEILSGAGHKGPPEVVDNVVTATELAESIKELAEHGLKSVAGIASIVGAAGVVLDLLDNAGLFGRKAGLDDVLRSVHANYTATVEASKISHLQNMAPLVAVAVATADAMKTFVAIPGTRGALAGLEQAMVTATNALTDRAYQLVVFNLAEYIKFPWLWDDGWLDVPRVVAQRVPSGTPAVARYHDHPANTARFDYRFALGNIVFAVTTRVQQMHALEPEFRSTGRYREQLRTLCGRLKELQWQWLQSIQWSFHPSDAEHPPHGVFVDVSSNAAMSWDVTETPWTTYLPVGAVDICTGVSVWLGRYRPNWDPSAGFEKPAYWTHRPNLHTWPPQARSAYYQEARRLREAARQTILEQSGYLAFAAFVTSVCKLVSDPDQSETVAIRPSFEVFNLRWVSDGRVEKTVGGLFCERKTYSAEVWTRGSPTASLMIRTQTPESIATWPIKYEYLLQTGAGEVPLTTEQRTATLRAPHFVAERGPAGERRDVEINWADTVFTYNLAVTTSHSTLSLDVGSGVNTKVLVLVRETIQSGAVFTTMHEVTFVTQEQRLPSTYFQHLQQCGERANRVLGEINRKYSISEAPGPKFDPRQTTVGVYINRIQRERPADLQHAIDALGFRS